MWASAPTNVSKTMFGRTILSALSNIVHHWRIRRWPVISTAGCFALSLRGNCFRWERCLHAGGAVVQLCREIPVCWLQRFSTGSFCGTAVQSDPHPAPLFAHFFWQDRKSRPPEAQLRCRRINGTSGETGQMGGQGRPPLQCAAETCPWNDSCGITAKERIPVKPDRAPTAPPLRCVPQKRPPPAAAAGVFGYQLTLLR